MNNDKLIHEIVRLMKLSAKAVTAEFNATDVEIAEPETMAALLTLLDDSGDYDLCTRDELVVCMYDARLAFDPELTATEDWLSAVLASWCKTQRLPNMPVDELMMRFALTREQREWLLEFSGVWTRSVMP